METECQQRRIGSAEDWFGIHVAAQREDCDAAIKVLEGERTTTLWRRPRRRKLGEEVRFALERVTFSVCERERERKKVRGRNNGAVHSMSPAAQDGLRVFCGGALPGTGLVPFVLFLCC